MAVTSQMWPMTLEHGIWQSREEEKKKQPSHALF